MKIILVTGGNRGIGLEICRQLSDLGHTVIMGSRDLENGEKAALLINKKIIVGQLDVTNDASVGSMVGLVEGRFGKLDVLINNAGLGATHSGQGNILSSGAKRAVDHHFPVAAKMIRKWMPSLRKAGIVASVKSAGDVSFGEVKVIMETNFYGPWRMIRSCIPLLRKSDDGRIINMSSGMGGLNSLTGEYPAYSLSKSSLNALTIMFSNELKETGIKVNAMCPGWVRTDMGGPNAPRTVNEGADTAIWLATEKEITTGKFFRDRKVINW
ncbi:MAG: SDR family oxidoreductase [Bacteroidales bacterium]|nr:SDR family oxidoreductase [Bacteroidales bacterium]